ncbi:uncharacterized protein LOC120351196 [Nilaparvata lugens]|uniref:uncharacterized protein LOC120351196 n=1 Tax=Nilaparvata lugens TaxID=108931 RepID=UPI00193E8760|nr:uncharacterized protein LOC120351196 [Nilaparvata lugens]XP_039283467.1 uncharacterized protein LOC120351196 [Nilaparvata lugens]
MISQLRTPPYHSSTVSRTRKWATPQGLVQRLAVVKFVDSGSNKHNVLSSDAGMHRSMTQKTGSEWSIGFLWLKWFGGPWSLESSEWSRSVDPSSVGTPGVFRASR